eukprot:ctg_1872.g705
MRLSGCRLSDCRENTISRCSLCVVGAPVHPVRSSQGYDRRETAHLRLHQQCGRWQESEAGATHLAGGAAVHRVEWCARAVARVLDAPCGRCAERGRSDAVRSAVCGVGGRRRRHFSADRPSGTRARGAARRCAAGHRQRHRGVVGVSGRDGRGAQDQGTAAALARRRHRVGSAGGGPALGRHPLSAADAGRGSGRAAHHLLAALSRLLPVASTEPRRRTGCGAGGSGGRFQRDVGAVAGQPGLGILVAYVGIGGRPGHSHGSDAMARSVTSRSGRAILHLAKAGVRSHDCVSQRRAPSRQRCGRRRGARGQADALRIGGGDERDTRRGQGNAGAASALR